nr:hypothetical protein [Tanacetum cinerariifolium]
MADVNVNAPAEQAPTMAPPTHSDDQILPRSKWAPVGKNSPLHLPYEEYILGYLKFSAKGTKQEVFRMPIPNELITADIQGEQDYKEYLEKVAKHQRYLDGEEGSDLESPAPKPAKATKKSKPSSPKADLRPPVSKPASSQQPKPKPTPAKSQEKKRKLVIETSDKPSPAKRSKPGLVTKRRKPTSSLRLVDESIDEGIPAKEPRFDDEEADIQRAVEESLKSVHDAPRGPLPPVVIREPDSRKFQPLTEVQGKGKEKVNDEQVTRELLTLQTPKKVSPAEQYIFQRRTPVSTKPSCHAESPLIYVALDFSFGDLFFNDKHSEAENEKTTAETKAESMVSLTIQQDTSAIPPITTPVIDLTSRPDSPNSFWIITSATSTPIYQPGRLKPSVSSILEYLYMDDDMAPDEHVHSSDDEDIENAHIPKVNLQQDWWKPLEEDISATPKPAWSIPSSDLPILTNNWASALADWFFKRQGITKLKPQDLEGPAFELVKVFHP